MQPQGGSAQSKRSTTRKRKAVHPQPEEPLEHPLDSLLADLTNEQTGILLPAEPFPEFKGEAADRELVLPTSVVHTPSENISTFETIKTVKLEDGGSGNIWKGPGSAVYPQALCLLPASPYLLSLSGEHIFFIDLSVTGSSELLSTDKRRIFPPQATLTEWNQFPVKICRGFISTKSKIWRSASWTRDGKHFAVCDQLSCIRFFSRNGGVYFSPSFIAVDAFEQEIPTFSVSFSPQLLDSNYLLAIGREGRIEFCSCSVGEGALKTEIISSFSLLPQEVCTCIEWLDNSNVCFGTSEVRKIYPPLLFTL